MRKLNPKYQQILEIIRENSPMHLLDLRKKIWQKGIYSDNHAINKALTFLRRTKKIRGRGWRVELV